MLNRREFFGAAPAALAPAVGVQVVPPEKAYVVMAREYDYNDEYNYEGGSYIAEGKIYYDLDEAEKRADALNQAFYGDPDEPGRPDEWEIPWDDLDTANWEGFDNDLLSTYTWNDVLKHGWSAPHWVEELTDASKAAVRDPAQDPVLYRTKLEGAVRDEYLPLINNPNRPRLQ